MDELIHATGWCAMGDVEILCSGSTHVWADSEDIPEHLDDVYRADNNMLFTHSKLITDVTCPDCLHKMLKQQLSTEPLENLDLVLTRVSTKLVDLSEWDNQSFSIEQYDDIEDSLLSIRLKLKVVETRLLKTLGKLRHYHSPDEQDCCCGKKSS